MGEEGNTIEAGEGGRSRSMPRGKLVLVALMKEVSLMRRGGEDQMGMSRATEVMPWKWWGLGTALAEEQKTAWLNVGCSSQHRGQSLLGVL